MLDIKYIKEKPQEVIDRLAKKGKDAAEDIQAILDLDTKRRELIAGVEAAKAEQNQASRTGTIILRKLLTMALKYDIIYITQ